MHIKGSTSKKLPQHKKEVRLPSWLVTDCLMSVIAILKKAQITCQDIFGAAGGR